jgi:NAD(P)-dependent dehydrogenase (short-subunit alcohol dehydrogenase family)
MRDLVGKVAVVTGAASGIGRALAERCAGEGMRLVLADVEEAPLAAVAEGLRAQGCEVEDTVADVRESAALEDLADRCQARFGGAHLLCNNAGVAVGGPLWEVAEEDWSWILDVNLVGVIHGIRAFLPRMIADGEEGHVVNTASIAGLTCPALVGPYNVTKHAVVALSESLLNDLRVSGSRIGVSVLCPGWVQTRIHESDRNRPGPLPEIPEEIEMMRKMVGDFIAGGVPPKQIADAVLDAVRENRFWIRTHPAMEPLVKERCDTMAAGETPPPMLPTQIV